MNADRSSDSASKHRRSDPPPLAAWLVRRALRTAAEREMVLGDLQEELSRFGPVW